MATWAACCSRARSRPCGSFCRSDSGRLACRCRPASAALPLARCSARFDLRFIGTPRGLGFRQQPPAARAPARWRGFRRSVRPFPVLAWDSDDHEIARRARSRHDVERETGRRVEQGRSSRAHLADQTENATTTVVACWKSKPVVASREARRWSSSVRAFAPSSRLRSCADRRSSAEVRSCSTESPPGPWPAGATHLRRQRTAPDCGAVGSVGRKAVAGPVGMFSGGGKSRKGAELGVGCAWVRIPLGSLSPSVLTLGILRYLLMFSDTWASLVVRCGLWVGAVIPNGDW